MAMESCRRLYWKMFFVYMLAELRVQQAETEELPYVTILQVKSEKENK